MIRTMSAGGEALVRLEVVLELAALDELHRDVPDAAFLADVVDGDDVGVREPPGRLRLAAKARDHGLGVLAGELIGADRLERDDALDHAGRSLRRRRPWRRGRARGGSRTCRSCSSPPSLLPGSCRSRAGCRPKTTTPAAGRRRCRGRERRVTCTCCRFPRRSSGSGAGPWCRGRRRPAATARRPAPRSTWRRPPSSPRCSPGRPARWSRRR